MHFNGFILITSFFGRSLIGIQKTLNPHSQKEDLATAQAALALDLLVNTAELDTQVDIYQQGISHFREIYGCKQAALHLAMPAI